MILPDFQISSPAEARSLVAGCGMEILGMEEEGDPAQEILMRREKEVKALGQVETLKQHLRSVLEVARTRMSPALRALAFVLNRYRRSSKFTGGGSLALPTRASLYSWPIPTRKEEEEV